MERGLKISNALFRRLIAAYSTEYREQFGDEMTQVFRDLCADVYRRDGLAGLIRLWAGTFFDLLVTALEERLGRLPLPSDAQMVVLGGWSAIGGGIIAMVLAFTHASPSWIEFVFRLEAIWPALGILTLTGLLGVRAWRRLGEIPADAGLIIAHFGTLVMAISGIAMLLLNRIWISFGNGLLLVAAGLLLTSLLNLRTLLAERIGALLLSTGFFTLMLSMFTPYRNMGKLFYGDGMLFAILMGLGWIATGLALLTDRTRSTATR